MKLDADYKHQLDALLMSIKSRKIGLKDVSDATGVHISQISRILSGKAVRVSPNVEKICKFAKTFHLQGDHAYGEKLLITAIKGVWNGTNDHAFALANLLSAIDTFQGSIQKIENNISMEDKK